MKILWRKEIRKEAELLFTVPVGIPFWYFGEHDTLFIELLLPIISSSKWRLPWTIIGSERDSGTARDPHIELKLYWDKQVPACLEGKL